MYHDYNDEYDCDYDENDCEDCEAYHDQRWREYKKKKSHKERDKKQNSFWDEIWDIKKDKDW